MDKKERIEQKINEVNLILVGLLAKVSFYQKQLQNVMNEYNSLIADELQFDLFEGENDNGTKH